MALTEAKISKLRTTDSPQILRDSPGLFLQAHRGEPEKPIERGTKAVVCPLCPIPRLHLNVSADVKKPGKR